jgi:hypothetical protein
MVSPSKSVTESESMGHAALQRVSDPDYFKGLELEVSVERNGRAFEGGGVNGDWLITSDLCEKVIEAICAECDSIHGELDYLCPSCRLTV